MKRNKMYFIKLVAAVLMMMMAVSFAACGKETSTPGVPSQTSPNEDDATSGNTEPQQPEPQQIPPTPTAPMENVFYNPENYFPDLNNVSIKPEYVYWDGDKLVARCFVINGYNHAVYDVCADDIAFSNESGLIAEAGFGLLRYDDGYTVYLNPGQYIEWTFIFPEDCVARKDAILSGYLAWDCRTSNKY